MSSRHAATEDDQMELQTWMIFKNDEPFERVERRSVGYVIAYVDWLNSGHWNRPYTYALFDEKGQVSQ